MNLDLPIKSICSIIDAIFIESKEVSEEFIIRDIVIDSRSPRIKSNTLFILLEGNKSHGRNYTLDFYNKEGRVVLTTRQIEGTNLAQIIVKDPILALQKIAAFHRGKFNIPIIGITGSNGKTTVKEWLYHLLKDRFSIVRSPKSYNSQIGVPLSVLELNSNHTLGVFEAGISKPGEMQLLKEIIQPTIGVFTGLGDAHNEGFSDPNPKEQKKNEKYKLFEGVGELIAFDEGQIQFTKDDEVKDITGESDSIEIQFKDKASHANSRIVFSVAKRLGMTEEDVKAKLKTLPTISMRLEKMSGRNGNLLINDAYTIDEKSLEIGLQFLELNTLGKKAVLFIAEDVDRTNLKNTLLNAVARMQSQIKLDKIIYFGPETIGNSFQFVEQTYPTINSFKEDPLELSDATILFTGSRNWHLEQVVNYYTSKKHITQLRVNFAAIRNNLNIYRKQLDPGVQILAMVKAQSYGGGILEMAQFLQQEGVHYLGVAYADEGISLRKAGVELPILVMNPEGAAFDDIIDYSLEPSIYSMSLLNDFIHQLILREKIHFPIHLKLDTGMNRLGFRTDNVDDLLAMLHAQPEVYVKSVFSHLSVADNLSEIEYTNQQIEKFETLTEKIGNDLGYPFTKHIANSAGALNFKNAQFDMVRIGIGMFGLLTNKSSLDFQNALELFSQISQIRIINTGESVGYGRSFIARHQMRIGIVPVGYGDGLRRQLGEGKWSVTINDYKYPIIGKICMDMCMIDLTNADALEGDEVKIFGDGNSVFEMSQILDTIPYEIISSISSRVQRVYLEE